MFNRNKKPEEMSGDEMQEMVSLLKQNNKMLKRAKTARQLKLVFYVLSSLFVVLYVHYWYNTNRSRIDAVSDNVNSLVSQFREVSNSINQAGAVLNSFSSLLGDSSETPEEQ